MRVRGTRVRLPSAGTFEPMSWHNVMYDILIRVLILSDVRPVKKEVPSPPGIITREPCMLPAVATLRQACTDGLLMPPTSLKLFDAT